MANLKKQTEVKALTSLLSENSNFALVKFEKTKHTAMEKLRKELKKNDSKLRVVKNTLLSKALGSIAQLRGDATDTSLKDNTALLSLGEDYAKGLSAFYKFAKEDKTVGFKFGLLEKKFYQESDLTKIAQLPSRDELIAKLIGSLKSPSTRLVMAMKFNITKLTMVLKERSKQAN